MLDSSETRHQAILSTIAQIPKGYVSTYGEVASLAGYPGNARLVGRILKKLPSDTKIPWHRVVNASGRSSFPDGSDKQREQFQKLQEEKIVILNGRIRLSNYKQHGNEC